MNDVWKLKPTNATVIFFCAMNAFLVSFAVFLLARPLFFILNLWQMVMISVSVSGSLLLVNIMAYARNNWPRMPQPAPTDEKGIEQAHLTLLATTGVLTVFVLLLSLVISYLAGFTLKHMVAFTIVIDFLLIALLIWGKNKEIKRKQRSERQMKEVMDKFKANLTIPS